MASLSVIGDCLKIWHFRKIYHFSPRFGKIKRFFQMCLKTTFFVKIIHVSINLVHNWSNVCRKKIFSWISKNWHLAETCSRFSRDIGALFVTDWHVIFDVSVTYDQVLADICGWVRGQWCVNRIDWDLSKTQMIQQSFS